MIIIIQNVFLSIALFKKYNGKYTPTGWSILPQSFGGNMDQPIGVKWTTEKKC